MRTPPSAREPCTNGNEAVLAVGSFSLEGRGIRKVRQAVSRLERRGFRFEVRWAGDVSADLRSGLAAIHAEWAAGASRGFVMSLDDVFALDGPDAVFAIGRDGFGTARGFLHLAAAPAGSTLSLSSMLRQRSVPNGFNEWLICRTIEWGCEQGLELVSLNFAPFARLLAPRAEVSAVARIEREALLAIKDRLGLQLDNLFVFNEQFHPEWVPRYVVVERWSELPRVALAAMRAEGYLGPRAREAA